MTDIMGLLKEKGFTLKDVEKLLEDKKEKLKEKKHVYEKDVWSLDAKEKKFSSYVIGRFFSTE